MDPNGFWLRPREKQTEEQGVRGEKVRLLITLVYCASLAPELLPREVETVYGFPY